MKLTIHNPARQAGFSLIELMVALAIGLVLTIGVISLMVSTSRTHAELSKNSRQIENGRAAMDFLMTEIRHAGFYGEFGRPLPAPAAAPSPCATDLVTLREAMSIPIQGFDGPSGAIPGCVTGAGHVAGTDVLVLRRAQTLTEAAPNPARVYLQGAPTEWRLDNGDITNFTLLDRNDDAVPIREYRTDIYFVGLVDGRPALRRLELGSGFTAAGALTIADGIQNLQIDFGIDRSGDGSPSTSDAGGDAYVALPSTLDEWLNVVALRVHVLARNPEATPGYEDQKRYMLGLTTTGAELEVGPFADAFRRHVYHSAIRASNISGRRD